MRKHAKTKGNPTVRFRRLSLTTVVVATILLAVWALTVISRQTAGVKASGVTESGSVATGRAGKKFAKMAVAGQEVEVNGQTGRVKDLTPEEAQRLAAGLKKLVNKSSEGLEEVRHADGSVSVDVQGRFQSVTVAKVDEDGNLVTSCVDNPRAAAKFFGIDPKLMQSKDGESKTLNRVEPGSNQN